MGRPSEESRFRRFRRLVDGSYHAAVVRYGRRLLADYPDIHPVWVWVGDALVALARYEEAEQAFAKAIELSSAEKRQISLAHMGHLFFEAGDYDQAASWYRRAIEADPDDASYRIYLGGVLAKQGRLIEAEEVHRMAVGCSDGCIEEAYLNLGLVLLSRERFLEAAECFREAVRRDPDYRAARRALRDVERCLKLG